MSAPAETRDASGPSLIQQRLVGLAVLLGLAFLLSLLVSQGGRRADRETLQPVVIPLGGGTTAPTDLAASAPEPEAPSLDPVDAPAPGSPAREPAASPSPPPPPAAKPAPKPAAPKASPPPPAPKPAAAAPKAPPPAKPPAAKPAAGPWFVVVGAYKDPLAAKAIANRAQLAGFKAEVVPVKSGGEQLHRVRAGPFASTVDAESARATLIVEGLTKSVITSGR